MDYMFEKRERWIQELNLELQNKDAAVSQSGYMTLLGIAAEIRDTASVDRGTTVHDGPVWLSLQKDLEDGWDYTSEALRLYCDAEYSALRDQVARLMTLTTNKYGRVTATIDKDERDKAIPLAESLVSVLTRGDASVAAWRGLVDSSKNMTDPAMTRDRIAYLRQTLFGILIARNIDIDFGSHVSDIREILAENHRAIARIQFRFGDIAEIADFDREIQNKTTQSERDDLIERILRRGPEEVDAVVWFRIEQAYIRTINELTYGNIVFYRSDQIAYAITDEAAARSTFGVTPEELFTKAAQDHHVRPPDGDEEKGFTYEPLFVYARVQMTKVQPHSAENEARKLLQTVIGLTYPQPGAWNILDGVLLFVEGRAPYRPLAWSRPAHPRSFKPRLENDRFMSRMGELKAEKHVIDQKAMGLVGPAVELTDALKAVDFDSDPKGVIMAAVRALEHCKTWTVKRGHTWYTFIDEYLIEATMKIRLRQKLRFYLYAALEHEPIHLSMVQPSQDKLLNIKRDVYNTSHSEVDFPKLFTHFDELEKIHDCSPYTRALRDIRLILKDDDSIREHLEQDRARILAQTARLTRSRNSLIHGGTLSIDACESLKVFAEHMASQALTAAVKSVLDGRGTDLAPFFADYRDDHKTKLESFISTQNLNVLFS